jgi:hypothetical protein
MIPNAQRFGAPLSGVSGSRILWIKIQKLLVRLID